MIIYNEKLNKPIILEENKPTVIVIQELSKLQRFKREIYNQINGEEGAFTLFDNEKSLKFETYVDFITDILLLTLNTRKAVNYLHKELSLEVGRSEAVIQFEELKKRIIDFLSFIRKQTLIDFSFEDEIEVEKILKMFDVKFSERLDMPLDLLIKYIDLLHSFSKIKVVFVSFAFYLFNVEEIETLVKYALQIGLQLVFIEKNKPYVNNMEFRVIYLEDDYIIS